MKWWHTQTLYNYWWYYLYKNFIFCIFYGKDIHFKDWLICNKFRFGTFTFCPLTLEKTLTQIFRSVPSSGIFLKHYSKHIKSVSTGDQISMPNEMSRTTTMMHARFTSTQRCISSGAGLNLVLDQVLWRRRISSLIRLKWCVLIINNMKYRFGPNTCLSNIQHTSYPC